MSPPIAAELKGLRLQFDDATVMLQCSIIREALGNVLSDQHPTGIDMNSFDAMGQAHLDAAEGHIQLSYLFGGWLKQVATSWLDAVIRHMPERAMPW